MNYLNSIFKFLSVAFLATTMSACTIDDATDVPLVALGSIEKNFVVEADASTFDIDIYANGAYHVDRINESDWLKLELGSIEDGKSKITADVEFNEGFKRMAGLVLCSDVDARRDTIYVRQKALIDARIEFDNSSVIVKGAGGTESTPIITNVPFEDMTVEIKYTNESNADWVESLVIEDADTEERSLVISTVPNEDPEAPRSASVSLSFTDGWNETVSVSFNLLQRSANETMGREITMEEFRANYAMNDVIEDYVIIEGIVVSNTVTHSQYNGLALSNAGDNTQETTSTIDYTVSARTVYLESYDGAYGVALLTSTEEDNVFEQYDHVQLLIQGTTGMLYENPDRYEIHNVTSAMVISRTAGSKDDVPDKTRSINQLTDQDIYTYVTLTNVEFPIRKGSITPVNGGYTIDTNAHRLAKYPLLVRDINGDAMYMMTNTNCAYRSDGTRLPYGSGNISGVIVHERFSRFEWRNGADPADIEYDPTLGYIGRYQIRHQTKEDIWGEMNDSVEDSFSALLTEYRFWNPDIENEVCLPTYGTNGWLTHTYQEKYTGSSQKEYMQQTYQQHMYGAGTYDYLGPLGNNEGYAFGYNVGNKNGCGIIIDPAKEHYSQDSRMLEFISNNPDGTIEWCGPYAKNAYAGNGAAGWSNITGSTYDTEINYNSASRTSPTGLRGKGNVSGNCYTAFGNNYWWDYDNNRGYAWLINFSTADISTSHISMQIAMMNGSQNFYAPRFWKAEWALTDSQAAEDDDQWHLIGEFTVPDVSVWSNTLFSSITAFKGMNFELPQEILGHENVYIRLMTTSDLCSDGSDYANAHFIDKNPDEQGANYFSYFAIRYNK